MEKVTYSMDQIKQLAFILNSLEIKGIAGARLIALAADILDNPIETINNDVASEEQKKGEDKNGAEA